jgi:hypothetical protein
MTPAFQIVIGLLLIAGGGFVVVQGLRAKAKFEAAQKPLPGFFKVAFIVHAAIALIGLLLVAKSLIAMAGA